MDRLKFELILRKENKKIFNYLLKILRNREDAEDILQDVFLSFYKKIENINEQAYQSYLFRTAYNKALNLIKYKKKRNKLNYHVDNVENYSNNNPLKENNSQNELIIKALKQLSIKDATLIELQFYQKKNYKEIANFFSTTISAIDSRLVRAKKKLRQIILQEMKKSNV